MYIYNKLKKIINEKELISKTRFFNGVFFWKHILKHDFLNV